MGPALREVILTEDNYKILVNGELVWDDIGFRAYSQDILRFSGSPDNRMMQSRFYVFLAVGKLMFGRHDHSQAVDFAWRMPGAQPLVAKEPPSLKIVYLPF